MDIISDYTNWKFENYDLIDSLVKRKSNIIRRFPHVILVTDYYYDLVVNNNKTLTEDEEVIFSTGFNYLYDRINTIDLILKNQFNNNIDEMEKISKTINLLLYTNDFQQEYENSEDIDLTKKKKLDDFEEKVLKYIESHINAPDEMFALLSDITTSIFDDYMGINEIMYEVCLDLGIAPDEDDQTDYVYSF